MDANDICYLSIAEAAAALRRKEVSPLDLTDACIARIDALDSRLHSFITPTFDRARAQARRAEQELRSGNDRGLSFEDVFGEKA